jgi:hypothetical protein
VSPLVLNAEAHFLALWGSLLGAEISESKIYDVLSEEASHNSLSTLAQELREELEKSTSLSDYFQDDLKRSALRPWVLKLVLKFEGGGNTQELAKALITAGKILHDEATSRSRSLFWKKIRVLNTQKIDPDEILESLAKDASNAQDLEFSETLYVAARRCANGKSLLAALAKSAKSLWRSEKLLLASAIGTDDLIPLFDQLAELARLRETRKAKRPTTEKDAPRNLEAQGKTTENIKRTISGAISSVGDLLGLNSDEKDQKQNGPRPSQSSKNNDQTSQAVRLAVESARQQRRDGRKRRAEDISNLGGRSPKIHVKGKRSAQELVAAVKSHDPNDSSAELIPIQKTIGPAWMNPRAENPNSPSNKTIGPDFSLDKKNQKIDRTENPKITIVPREKKQTVLKEQVSGPISVDRLRAYLLLLEESPEHMIIADQVEQGIASLRNEVADSFDPDDEALRRELDDLDLAFGSWKAQNGR